MSQWNKHSLLLWPTLQNKGQIPLLGTQGLYLSSWPHLLQCVSTTREVSVMPPCILLCWSFCPECSIPQANSSLQWSFPICQSGTNLFSLLFCCTLCMSVMTHIKQCLELLELYGHVLNPSRAVSHSFRKSFVPSTVSGTWWLFSNLKSPDKGLRGDPRAFMVPSLQDPETRTGLVSQGSLQLKPGTGSCIQSGQKCRSLTAGEVGNWQFPGRAWMRRGARYGLNGAWEDGKGKAIRGGKTKESQLMQLVLPRWPGVLEGQ